MAKDPHCHWCEREVVLYYVKEWGRNGYPKQPDDMATLDHIYDRFDTEKREESWRKKDPNRHVLACYRCNHDRNEKKMKFLAKNAKEFLQIRQKLAEERKKRGDTTARPTVFRGLEKLIQYDDAK